MFKKTTTFLLLFCFSLPAYSGHAIEGENHFSKANAYTVKVKKRVKYPFIKDKKGSFSGAGFLIEKNLGWIVTNAHVSSRNPESLDVAFKGSKFIEAKLHYIDHLLDFAVIKIAPEKVPDKAQVADLECTNKPVVGSPAGAFGHPYSLSFSGTRGIISGEKYKWGRLWIQTDAPINKGNSGGPLISLNTGKVIGISSATLSKKRSEGLGFAVPMIHACKVIDLLKKGVDPSPSYIPVEFAYDDDNERELIAAVIYKKQPTSWPLQVGDRLVAMANNPSLEFENQASLIHTLRGVKGNIDVIIERSGKKQTVSITSKPRTSLMKRIGLHVSGVVIANDTYRDDEETNPRGLPMIHDVATASIGSAAGISSYDLVVSVDGRSVPNLVKLCKYLKQVEQRKKKVNIITKSGSWSYRSRSKYGSHEIKVKDVKLVGPQAPDGCESVKIDNN